MSPGGIDRARPVRWTALVALMFVFGAGIWGSPARADWTASGIFKYTDKPWNQDGFTGGTAELPIRHAQVQICDAGTEKVLAMGATDSLGHFRIFVPDSLVRDVYAKVLTNSGNPDRFPVAVRDYQFGGYFSFDSPTFFSHEPAADLEDPYPIVSTLDHAAPAFNILDNLVDAVRFFKAIPGNVLPGGTTVFRWSRTLKRESPIGDYSFYLEIPDPRAYDDNYILARAGSILVLQITGVQYSPSPFDLVSNAWDQGAGLYFAAATNRYLGRRDPALFPDLGSGTGEATDLSRHRYSSLGAESPVPIGSLLYLLAGDPGNPRPTDSDGVEWPSGAVWNLIQNAFHASNRANLEIFWRQWLERGISRAPDVQSAMQDLGIDYKLDPWEPNGTQAQAVALNPDATSNRFSLYPEGDHDLFHFPSKAGARYLIRAVDLGNGCIPVLQIQGRNFGVGGSYLGPRAPVLDYLSDSTTERFLDVWQGNSSAGFGSYKLQVVACDSARRFERDIDSSHVAKGLYNSRSYMSRPGTFYQAGSLNVSGDTIGVFVRNFGSPARSVRKLWSGHGVRGMQGDGSGTLYLLTDGATYLANRVPRTDLAETTSVLVQISPSGSSRELHLFTREELNGQNSLGPCWAAGAIFGVVKVRVAPSTDSWQLFRADSSGNYARTASIPDDLVARFGPYPLPGDRVGLLCDSPSGTTMLCFDSDGTIKFRSDLSLYLSSYNSRFLGRSGRLLLLGSDFLADDSLRILDPNGKLRTIPAGLPFSPRQQDYVDILEGSNGKFYIGYGMLGHGSSVLALDTLGHFAPILCDGASNNGLQSELSGAEQLAEGADGSLLFVNSLTKIYALPNVIFGNFAAATLVSAEPVAGGVRLEWTTFTESSCQFGVFRSGGADSVEKPLGVISGDANTRLLFMDHTLLPATPYRYRVGMRLSPGDAWNYSNIRTVTTLAPRIYMALPAPNPMRSSTRIEFEVPARGNVKLEVFNVAGQRVATLINQVMPAGNGSVTWNGLGDGGRTLADGMYFARLAVGGQSSARKILLLK